MILATKYSFFFPFSGIEICPENFQLFLHERVYLGGSDEDRGAWFLQIHQRQVGHIQILTAVFGCLIHLVTGKKYTNSNTIRLFDTSGYR